jgi:hypothetical protein
VSFDDLELVLMLLGDADAGPVVITLPDAVLSIRVSVEDIVEQLLADFDVKDRKILDDDAIGVGRGHMAIMHLAGLRYDRQLDCLGDALIFCAAAIWLARLLSSFRTLAAFVSISSQEPMIENSCSPPEIGTMFITFNAR